jgi:hypothetical protein
MPDRASELRAEQLRREQAKRGSVGALPSRPTADAAAQDRDIRQGMRQGAGSFIANVLSIPHGTGKLLAAGAALPALIPGGQSYSEARTAQEGKLPASALLAIPDVSTEQVLAAPTAIGRSFSNANANASRAQQLLRDPNAAVPPMASVSVPQNYAAAVAEEQKLAAANPLSSSAGRTAGDVGSMLTLRPGQRALEALDLKYLNPRAELAEVPGALNAAARTLARGTGRTAEAGIDGAAIAALGDGDPAKTAAYSAGVQAAGSAALAAKNAFLRNPLKSFAGLYLGHEMWKAALPGPQNMIESKDAAVNGMVAAYGLGAAAAIAGSSRGVGPGSVRSLTDAISSASRTSVASIVTQLQEADAKEQPQYAKVLELLSQDQELFGTDARVRLERASRSEEPRALLNEIDALMRSTRFKSIYDRASAEE